MPTVRPHGNHRKPLGLRIAVGTTWATLLAAVSIVAASVAVDTGGAGLGFWGVELLTQAALVASLAGLGVAGPRWARLANAAGAYALGVPLLATFPPAWLLGLLNSPSTPFYADRSGGPTVALTIDDSVDPTSTPAILDVLANHDVQATFFVLSDSIDGNEALLADIVAAGHEIANHQTADVRGWRMSPAEFSEDIRVSGERLRRFGEVRWLRPGGGFYDGAMVAAAETHGSRLVLGSVFPLDSHIASSRFVANYLLARTHPGDIIVLHDGPSRGLRTAEALEQALPKLKQKGLRFVTLTGLLGAPRSHLSDR